MKAKTGFKMREVCGMHVLVAEGKQLINFGKMISLNDSAAYLWESIKDTEFTPESLAALLVEKYEIDENLALKDATAIAQKWVEAGIVLE